MQNSSSQSKISMWLGQFEDALASRNLNALTDLFATDCYWRDLIAFTWNIKTMEGREAIRDMAAATLGTVNPRRWSIEGEASEAGGITEAWITFETDAAHGKGHVRLNDQGCCWTLLTTAQALRGHEEKKGATREPGVTHGVFKDRETWAERRARDQAELGYTRQPYVVIVGGGQGGIALGARLKRLDVPTIILEKNVRAGDSWRNRYSSLCLHDPVWYDHMPYLPFPEHWPVFSPKDKLGDWLESYVKVMELDYWTQSACRSASYDETTREWTITVDRAGETVVLEPKQLVLATGMAGVPNLPDIPRADGFKGDIRHSSKHPGGAAYAGRKAVVIGSNNSAHDICADLWEHGADVIMVQRSTTHVSRSDTLMKLALGPLYSEEAVANGVTTATADLIFASIPYKVLPTFHKPLCDEMKKCDADFYRRLEAAGFMLDFGEDETGLFMKYIRRGSGYYIDVGASELIANGSIKLQTGQAVRISNTGVVMEDGTELPADLIVFATGYGSMNGWAGQLIGPEVADKVGKVWGLGSGTAKDPGPWEGELRNIWKPTRQEGLWFHGGNLHQSRHYSQFLALQLKARATGISTPVYGLQDAHHKA